MIGQPASRLPSGCENSRKGATLAADFRPPVSLTLDLQLTSLLRMRSGDPETAQALMSLLADNMEKTTACFELSSTDLVG